MTTETIINGLVFGFVSGVMLVVCTWVFVLPTVATIIKLTEAGTPPKGLFSWLVRYFYYRAKKNAP